MRALMLVAAVVGCAAPDDDERVAPCITCAPGDIADGLVGGTTRVVAINAAGTTVGAQHGKLEWLAKDLTVDHAVSLGDVGPDLVAIAPDGGGVAIAIESDGEVGNNHYDVVAFDPDGREQWRIVARIVVAVAAGTDTVFVSSVGVPSTPPGTLNLADALITAFDRATGAVRWTVVIPGPPGTSMDPRVSATVAIGALPDGGVALGGMFQGTLDLGGTAMPLVSTSRGTGFVAALDAAGHGRWARPLELGATGTASRFATLGIGPGGQIAATGMWATAQVGEVATFAGVTLAPSARAPSGAMVALLDATGAAVFVRAFDLAGLGTVASVVTDGQIATVAGSNAGEVPVAPYGHADQRNGFVASFDAAGMRWSASAFGTGDQRITVVGFAGAGMLTTISSHVGSTFDVEAGLKASLTYRDLTSTRDGQLLAWLVP